MKDIKYYIGPMSKNIVDSIILFSNDYNIKIGLIPSINQINYNSGYVGWKTDQFIKYVKNKTKNIIIERDHGFNSDIFKFDSENFIDIIHIDPWSHYKDYNDNLKYTIENINYINKINKNIYFEVGTEESIKKFEVDELDNFLNDLKNNLDDKIFKKIIYVVIQSGTKIKETKNIGNFNPDRLKSMINISKKYNLLTKEHNGDYLSKDDINKRFELGLSAINIAPEFGVFETDIILENINNDTFDKFFKICYNSKKWKKWVDKEFNPFENKKELIRICGHYQFNTKEFLNLNIKLDNIIKEKLYKKIKDLIL